MSAAALRFCIGTERRPAAVLIHREFVGGCRLRGRRRANKAADCQHHLGHHQSLASFGRFKVLRGTLQQTLHGNRLGSSAGDSKASPNWPVGSASPLKDSLQAPAAGKSAFGRRIDQDKEKSAWTILACRVTKALAPRQRGCQPIDHGVCLAVAIAPIMQLGKGDGQRVAVPGCARDLVP